MLKQKHCRQAWWPMYLLVLVLVGLLILAHRLAPSPGWRIFLEGGAVIVGYALVTFWLETHSTALLDQTSSETDNQASQLAEVEIIKFPLSSHVRCHFFIGSDPAITYEMPDHPINIPRSNGHHPGRTFPSLPEEAARPFSNN
jgi:hypothetical protein